MQVEIIRLHHFTKFEQKRTKGMGSKREKTQLWKKLLTPIRLEYRKNIHKALKFLSKDLASRIN